MQQRNRGAAGKFAPEPGSLARKQITLRLPKEQLTQFEKAATERQLTLTELGRVAIDEWLRNHCESNPDAN